MGLEVGGEVIPAEAGIWIPDIRLGGFRNDESRLPARHHARHASKARRAGREPLRRGGRGKPLPQFLIMVWSNGVVE